MCYNPVIVNIKGTDDYMRVPCGHCYECLNLKSFRNTLLLNQEGEKSKYCMFLTLTYNMRYVPVCRFEYSREVRPIPFNSCPLSHSIKKKEVEYRVSLRNISKRLSLVYENNLIDFSVFSKPEFDLANETFKKNLYRYFPENCFPYLSSYDAQTFVKRLRNHIKYTFRRNDKYKEMPIRYYIAGEYGPQSLRPHFHVLVYFDSDALYRRFGSIARKAWRFGIVDCSLSRGGTGAYCASYIAGNSCLPPFHQIKKIRPKSWHSSHLGQSAFKIIGEGLDSFTFERASSEFTRVIDRNRPVPPSFQVQGSLFPRCLGYGRAHHDLRYLRYTFLSRLRKLRPISNLRNMAKFLVEQTFAKNPLYQSFIDCLPKKYKNLEDVYYRLLCVSSRFSKMCRLLKCTSEQYLDKIECYYKCLERSLLKKFYTNPDAPISVYSYLNLTDKTPVEHLAKFAKFRFGLVLSDLNRIIERWNTSDNYLFVEAFDKSQRIFYNKFKHRELCDALGIFEYDRNKNKLKSQLLTI